MIRYQLFPRSQDISNDLLGIVECFKKHEKEIASPRHTLKSNEVLKKLEPDLKALGFSVEEGKSSAEKIKVPVLFGLNNEIEKFFDADAVSANGRVVLEVEAGRAFRNNQFLKDIFQACMMHRVEYLAVAVRNEYAHSDDFQSIFAFLETLYINGRLKLPLEGVLLIGY